MVKHYKLNKSGSSQAALARVRQKCRQLPQLAAGDVDHAGGDQVLKWNRNSTTHTLGPPTPSAVVQNGGEPAVTKNGRK